MRHLAILIDRLDVSGRIRYVPLCATWLIQRRPGTRTGSTDQNNMVCAGTIQANPRG
jgi:hypothetical protein